MPSPEPQSPPKLMTYAEAAEVLGGAVTENWLRTAVREKRIPHTRLSDRVIRFTEADLLAFYEQSRVEPAPAPRKSSGPRPSRAKRAS
jgi:excisionase family DNA binding protein